MKIEKLPSGNYRIRQQYKGKRYSIVLPYKPTTKEATELMAAKMGDTPGRLTLESAGRQYIDNRCNVLSPSSIKEYNRILKYLCAHESDFMALPLGRIEQEDIQAFVNRLTVGRSPKTVKCYYTFVASVLGQFRPSFAFRVDLPMAHRKETYTPTLEDVKRIFAAVDGTRWDVPFQLAAYGLRRSELCALTMADLEGNHLTINKSKVWDGSHWVIKDYPKTTESFRVIYLPDYLVEKIHRQGMPDVYIHKITPKLHKIQDKLGIPRFRLHDFRHFFASHAHALGLSDADIMATGGWKTDHVMKSVYRKAMRTEEAMKAFGDSMTTL
jgi:integrase